MLSRAHHACAGIRHKDKHQRGTRNSIRNRPLLGLSRFGVELDLGAPTQVEQKLVQQLPNRRFPQVVVHFLE
jgi:hypothetical protein